MVAAAEARSAEASAKAEGFRRDIAMANERAAEANRKAESERLARLQLELRLAPRTLSDDQKTRLIAFLAPFRGIRTEIVLFGDSYEIQTIGNAIIECLQEAGWVPFPKLALGGGGNTRGIPVGVKADSDPRTKKRPKRLFQH